MFTRTGSLHTVMNMFTCQRNQAYTRSERHLHAEANELTCSHKPIFTRSQKGLHTTIYTWRQTSLQAVATIFVSYFAS